MVSALPPKPAVWKNALNAAKGFVAIGLILFLGVFFGYFSIMAGYTLARELLKAVFG